jgi:glycosyltransferase involved in cell wall biosynthesis
MVCRLVPDKGCDDAIRLLARLPDSYHLAIAGSGPEMSNIVDLAAKSGVKDRTHMLGLLDDVRLAYAAFDNFLFLSKTEPFGLLLAEAMAAGVPVVGLGGEGGYREESYPLVTPETAVLLDRPNLADTASSAPDELLDRLAERIEGLNSLPDQRQMMAARAQDWVQERFGAGAFAGRIAGLYRGLLAAANR